MRLYRRSFCAWSTHLKFNQRDSPLLLILSIQGFKLIIIWKPLNPQAPVAQKITDKVVFRRFQGEGIEFFLNRTSLTPSDFWCASFGKYRFKLFQISFFSGFYIKIMFWGRWFHSLSERMRLKRKNVVYWVRCFFITLFTE